MADSDDRIARRYREIAREEPPLAVDAAILARARRKVRSRPGFARWAAPVSIAAVLVLGIGVSLRMQLEQPGIESSAPERASPATSNLQRYAPQSGARADAAPAPEEKFEFRQKSEPEQKQKLAAATEDKRSLPSPAKQAAKPALAAPPLEERLKDRADSGRTEDAVIIASPGAMAPIAPPGATFVPAPAPAPAAPPPPARAEIDVATRAVPEPPAAAATGGVAAQRAPQAQLAAPRAKKEAAADSFASRELNKSVAPADVDRDRELDRIAKLRESSQHTEADRALEAFRKRYPDFRIPEAMWERVRPR